MYWLVENEEQLNVLINSGYKKAFIEVIPYNDTIHPVQNHVSLVYIRPIEASKGFMVCIAHSESLNVLNTGIDKLINKFEITYDNKLVKDIKKSYWRIPQSFYSLIMQDAILLESGLTNEAAHDFLSFLSSDEARKIIIESGYEVPQND